MSYYDTLGVAETATADEIKKAYRQLSKQYHPDMSGGDDAKFKEISEAYEHLSNDVKRAQYDASRMNPFANMGGNGFAFDGNLSDMFNQFFGGDPRRARGQNHTIMMNISFMDAYQGSEKVFALNGEHVRINIPRGVKTGTKLRMKGKGEVNPYNPSAGRGDLIINIQVQPSPIFIVNGNDIWIDYNLPWWNIATGCKIDVELPDGSWIKVPVNKNSHHHKTLRIKDKGWPIYNTNKNGSLMIRLNATFPELNESQLEKLNELKEDLRELE